MSIGQLIEHLKRVGVLCSPLIAKALAAVDRADFVPTDLRHLAYDDTALPIGHGQTISQPYTVVFMLERLGVEHGYRVFEAGYGSGWQTALLAHMVGESGSVYAFEIVPALCRLGEKNLQKYPELARRATLKCGSARQGFETAAPFDCIICAAWVEAVPSAWRTQLKTGGRMIYPIEQGIRVETKQPDETFETKNFPGFVFVPFI